jgi:hypothetical protein
MHLRQLVVTISTLFLGSSAIASALPHSLAAQSPSAQLAVGGGSATDIRGITSSAVTMAPSVAVAWPGAIARLGASGTRFTSGSWALSGDASLGLRAPIASSRLALTLDAAAGATSTSYHTKFTTIGATPAAELAFRTLALFGGVHASQAWTAFGRVAAAPPALRSAALTRSSIGPVFGGRFALASFGAGGGLSLGYREEHARVEGVGVTDRAGTVSLASGHAVLTAAVGLRRASDEKVTFGAVSALVALSRAVALQVGAQRYPSDRLTGSLAGAAISAGILLRRTSGPRPLPQPHGVRAPAPGLTRLAIRAPSARAVEVAGDWSGWQLTEATRAGNGVWYADVALAPGEYRYAFRIDGKEWRTPDGAAATDDGTGGKSAWLILSRPTK